MNGGNLYPNPDEIIILPRGGGGIKTYHHYSNRLLELNNLSQNEAIGFGFANLAAEILRLQPEVRNQSRVDGALATLKYIVMFYPGHTEYYALRMINQIRDIIMTGESSETIIEDLGSVIIFLENYDFASAEDDEDNQVNIVTPDVSGDETDDDSDEVYFLTNIIYDNPNVYQSLILEEKSSKLEVVFDPAINNIISTLNFDNFSLEKTLNSAILLGITLLSLETLIMID